jgi:hypothetical protein
MWVEADLSGLGGAISIPRSRLPVQILIHHCYN